MRLRISIAIAGTCLVALAAGVPAHAQPGAPPASPVQIKLAPSALKPIAHVDARFQSYNVEMAEVVGGRFWAPYPKTGQASTADGAPKDNIYATSEFRRRPPVDLKGNRRLRTLAKALGPAYVRVSGTWANAVYFQDSDAPAPAAPPAGYDDVLTRAQWAGVVDFAKAVDAKIVTSFATSAGSRDASGAWTPEQARRLVNYTRSIGGEIYAAELTNEPNAGKYSPADYARDEVLFREFLKTDAPEIKSVGPGTVGAGFNAGKTEALLSAEPRPSFDIFDYHFYGAVSQRCSKLGKMAMISPDAALTEAWLARGDSAYASYAAQRDRFAPGAPIWITETAQTACGGDAWAATFLDTFRYVDQMGRLARRNVAAVFHNTLAASDYALIDDTTWQPRPNYWAALLWRRLMGETVLDAGPLQPGLHVYAHCLRDHLGGVAVVAINLDRAQTAALDVPIAGERYSLTADALQSGTVKLNGRPLALTSGEALPPLRPARTSPGALWLAPASITFLALPTASAAACR
jgi:hypothetical protein